MDQIISRASTTLVTFAVRSGVQVASTYVIKSVSTLMANVPEHEKKKLRRKKDELQNKIETMNYSIELLQLMAARGNSSLESVLNLAEYLHEDIKIFTKDIECLTTESKNQKFSPESLKLIEKLIDVLVDKIDKLVPLLNLVLTTYSSTSANNFQDYVSPGRLLNATTLVDQSNRLFVERKETHEVEVGPKFALTFYDIFYNNSKTSEAHIIWREKYAKCQLQLYRVVESEKEYSYELRIIEDFNDERYHDENETKGELKVDITSVSKLFFSASGRLLKLEDRSSPVLVFKLKKEEAKSKETELSDDDFKWIAFGDYEVSENSDVSEDEDDEDDEESENNGGKADIISVKPEEKASPKTPKASPLSLLEYLVRLCAVQANDQTSILNIKDERLRMYLSDENYNSNVTQQIKTLNEKMADLKL